MKKTLFSLFFALICANIHAQDAHFTQHYATPTYITPAMTGIFDGRIRGTVAYRSQWSSFLATPFNTFAATFDVRVPIGNKAENHFLGGGLDFYSDKLGGASYTSTDAMSISGAYHRSLDSRGDNTLSAGLRVGFAQRSINYEGLTFQDQFDPSLNNFSAQTLENPPRNNIAYTDLSTGIFWSTNPEKRTQYHAGLGLYHINQPNVALFQTKGNEAPLGLRTVVIVGAQFETAPRVDIIPRLVVMAQSGTWEANIGSNVRIGLDDYNDNSVYIGSWVRPVSDPSGKINMDAIVLMTGLQAGQIRIGASYDINISPLISVSKTVGAFELSVQYVGNYGEDKVMCPTF
jgi:type IX secretion system PorP/SprF family membrane protein